MNRNAEYEKRMKAKGLVKSTLWIPKHCIIEVKQMVEHCTENRDQIPFMARSIKTGKMKKAVD